MDAKQAVQIAKKHVAEIFSDEPIANVGLEEVEFDEIERLGDNRRLLAILGSPGRFCPRS